MSLTLMYTIKQLVTQFNISRSTLLYYDKIGLLSPSGRSESNYRLYSKSDLDRMSQINTYKSAGLSLGDIGNILEQGSDNSLSANLLEQRLSSLNSEISKLRQQQQLIVALLGQDSLIRTSKVMTKQQWVQILKSTGMNEEGMQRWHIEFEKDLPEAHTDFLESLGIDEEEIRRIKSWAY